MPAGERDRTERRLAMIRPKLHRYHTDEIPTVTDHPRPDPLRSSTKVAVAIACGLIACGLIGLLVSL